MIDGNDGSLLRRDRVSVPQRDRVSVPQRHTVSVRQRHTVSAPDRHAKKNDFRIETSGVRDETWWKFRAMPGGFWRQKQQTWPSAWGILAAKATNVALPSLRSSPLPRTGFWAGGLRGPRNWEVEERLGGRGIEGGVWV